MSIKRDFLDLDGLGVGLLRELLELASKVKAEPTLYCTSLAGKSLVMVFEAPSTRTRVSFEMAMRRLGGDVVSLAAHDMQLERGETPGDTARVLSRYADALLLRTDEASRLQAMAESSRVSVINGLTRLSHPCQIMADIMTFEERLGRIDGERLAYFGDASNNVAATWLQAAGVFGLELCFACPESHRPEAGLVERARGNGAKIVITDDPLAAANGSRAIMTDVWVSMGDDARRAPHNALAGYRVDSKVMGGARADAIFMHCLPAHRGEEVTEEVLEGESSAVWDEAENRLHVQKAILLWCLGADNLFSSLELG